MPEKITVLYIDDEMINLELFKCLFSDKYNVISGCCGVFGLDSLKRNPDIRVVISDMRMPEMSGLEFIAKARKNYIDKKYILLTGYELSDEIREALDSKLIDNFFNKPFKVGDIEQAINSQE